MENVARDRERIISQLETENKVLLKLKADHEKTIESLNEDKGFTEKVKDQSPFQAVHMCVRSTDLWKSCEAYERKTER